MPKGLTRWLQIFAGIVLIILGLISYEIVNGYPGYVGGLAKALVDARHHHTETATKPPQAKRSSASPPAVQNTSQVQQPVVPQVSANPASPSLFDTAWFVLMIALTCLFAWLILELRRRLDETAEVTPVLRSLQQALGYGPRRETGSRDRPAGMLEILAALLERYKELEGRLGVLEGALGRGSLGSEAGAYRAGSSSLQSAKTYQRPVSADRLRSQIEEEYVRLLVHQSPPEVDRFAEDRRVLPVEMRSGHIYVSDGAPANAWYWLVEDSGLDYAMLFPGRVALERLGSLMADGGSGLRQLLGFAFDIERRPQVSFSAALVQSGNSMDAPLIVRTRGFITLSWKG